MLLFGSYGILDSEVVEGVEQGAGEEALLARAQAYGGVVLQVLEGEDEVEEYDIVGRTEADPLNGKISDESPVGHALLEKAVGDTAEVLLPTGHTVNYKVLGITHSAN